MENHQSRSSKRRLATLTLLVASVLPAFAEHDAARVRALLDGDDAAELGATLELEAVCIEAPELPAPAGRSVCVLQLVLASAGLPPGGLALTVATAPFDAPLELHGRAVRPGELAGARQWVYLVPLETAAENRGVAVVLSAPGGRWGGAIAEARGEPLPADISAVVAEGEPMGRTGVAPAPAAGQSPVVRIVPPREEPVSGGTRFDVLVSRPDVDRVEFQVDGVRGDEDRHAPYAGRLVLASPARPQEVTAIAFDKAGRELGRDSLAVNAAGARFRVRISKLDGDPASGAVEVEAGLSLPPGGVFERLAFYFGETEVAERRAPPYRALVPTPSAGPSDYVRVAAFLADGSSIDDVALLAARGGVDEVEVNLVELFVVATDAQGKPVRGLGAADFEIRVGGKPQAIEGFRFADDLPLALGLVIDSSGSMSEALEETKRAAAGFLGATLREGDRAFLVDFDTQPRLAQAPTSELRQLFRAFPRLVAEGATALYDSIVFSLLQFGEGPGRKALVVLTDGDDYQSRFGPARAIEDARKSGVPVYVIGLGDPRLLKKIYKQNDLDSITGRTGGRAFFAAAPEELEATYAEIEAELRSQYFLTFYAPASELPTVVVEVKRPGIGARTVVGARGVQP